MFDINKYEQELEKNAFLIADEIINKAESKILYDIKLMKKYEHFGIGLWIRNNYIYTKIDIVENFDPDVLSHKIYNVLKAKLTDE